MGALFLVLCLSMILTNNDPFIVRHSLSFIVYVHFFEIVMAISDKPANRRNGAPYNTDIGELFVRRFNVVNLYVAALLLLAMAIVWSGIKTAEEVQQYHQD